MTKASVWLVVPLVLAACSKSEEPPTAAGAGSDAGGADASPAADVVGPGGCFQLTDGQCVVETFKNPPVLEPNADGVYEIDMVPGEFLVNGKRHCGRTYNGLFPAPTIITPAQVDGAPRSVRVNYGNRFLSHDYRSLGGDACDCRRADGMPCVPAHIHDQCVDPSQDDGCVCKNAAGDVCEHMFDFNTTNLHAHGSHTRPDWARGGAACAPVGRDGITYACRECGGDLCDGDLSDDTCYHGDNVLNSVHPATGAQYRWDIDEDGVHHEGLDWYHPHIHGSTAIQVASGATGAWIIRGPVDALPGIAKARERIFVIMTPPVDYEPLPDGQACDEHHITFNDFDTLGDTTKKQTNLLNGIRQPRLIMAPGQIERWRFLHGSFLDEMTIAVFKGKDADCKSLDLASGPIALTQIGRDGVTLPRPADGADWPYAPPYMFLSPGYRIDAMLDGSQLVDGDTLCLMSGRFLQEDATGTTDIAVGLMNAPTRDEILQRTTNGDLIAIVNVTASAGTPTETHMPDLTGVAKHAPTTMLKGGTLDALKKCEQAQAVTDIDQIDQIAALWVIFYQTEGMDLCSTPDHNINGKNFELTDRARYPYDRVFTVGDVEHWRLYSGFDGHPFHIHINPFLVCPLPAADSGHHNAKSRLFEPPFAHWRDTYLVNLDRTVDMITEYRTYTGPYVTHCHKLNHEDHGMMELITICDPSVTSCDTLCSGGPCAWNVCAEGDTDCERALAGTRCMVDPMECPEAALRCLPCESAQMSCPPDAHCADRASPDGLRRCVPGCTQNTDCSPAGACKEGNCVPAPCVPPCGPGTTCTHGVCG